MLGYFILSFNFKFNFKFNFVLVYLTMITEKFYQLFFKKLETSWKQEIFERKSE